MNQTNLHLTYDSRDCIERGGGGRREGEMILTRRVSFFFRDCRDRRVSSEADRTSRLDSRGRELYTSCSNDFALNSFFNLTLSALIGK